MNKSAFGLNENLAAALSYVLTGVTGILFLVVEKDNKFVRFHAMQSILFFLTIVVKNVFFTILAFIPVVSFVSGILSMVINLGFLGIYVYLIYMAYKGVSFKLPILGDVAYNQVNK